MSDDFSGTPFGPVAVILVNHGIWSPQDVPIIDMTVEQWDHTISANLTSSFLVCREFLRHLRAATESMKDLAAIVLIGSTSSKCGEANHGDYAISKSAMMCGLTTTLKSEIVKIAPRGRVNCIAPGWVPTPMVQEALNDPAISGPVLAATPLKNTSRRCKPNSGSVFICDLGTCDRASDLCRRRLCRGHLNSDYE
ncbi:hypothetical protein C8R48DRAFT_33059 [Suillus tomentosus]|nr:hypothetical protein C8R48DRAFT_33059 [Suillus tomentosus]